MFLQALFLGLPAYMFRQGVKDRQLALHKLEPGFRLGKPAGVVDLGIVLDPARTFGPLQREGVADDLLRPEVLLRRENCDDLAGRLPDGCRNCPRCW